MMKSLKFIAISIAVFLMTGNLFGQNVETILLVRLNTSLKKIEALKKNGQHKLAENTEQKQLQENKEIVKAFKENFDLYPVYFFYSYCSDNITKGNFANCLLDENLNILPQPDIKFNNYLIAEFGESEEMGIRALILKDKDFNQLDVWVRTYESIFFLVRTKSRVVELFNIKIKKK